MFGAVLPEMPMVSAHALVTRLSKHFDYRRPGKVVVLVLVQATSGHVIRPPGVKIGLVYLQQIDPLSAQQSQVLIQLGAQGVGRATTNAVVSASILILAANYVMTSLLFSE